MNKTKFEFCGSGLGLLWLFIWTTLATIFTFGLFFPWAATFMMQWVTENSRIGGRQLIFKGSGLGFFGNWLLIMFLSAITFCLYMPWGICRIYRWIADNLEFADEQNIDLASPQQDPRFAR